jgi:methionyl aminopeptidase
MNRVIKAGVWSSAKRTKKFGNYELILPNLHALNAPEIQNSVPLSIQKPDYSNIRAIEKHQNIYINTAIDLKFIRESCKLARQVLQFVGNHVEQGITTLELDRLGTLGLISVHEFIVERGAYPSPLNYMGFPNSICTSVNNVMCHGIPNNRKLKQGDIVNIDVTVYLNGYHGDTSATFMVGKVDDSGSRLVKASKEALDAGIAAVKPGLPFNVIAHAIETIADRYSLKVSPDFCGHGIGKVFHQAPFIFHTRNQETREMKSGMVFTIEPVLCQGDCAFIKWPDDWTVVSVDGGRSAQFEHTVLVTDDGCEVLT